MEKAPYSDFVDFIERINRRKCNRGTVMKLAKAGAFGDMVNLKWLEEHVETVWKRVQKLALKTKGGGHASKSKAKKADVATELRALLASGLRQPDYNPEELGLLSAEVNPMAFGLHPIDAWDPFVKRVLRGLKIQSMGSQDYHQLLDDRGHWVLVMIKKSKKHQVGDFGDVEPDHPDFGKPYANVNVEDSSGVERRIKFHHSVYDHCQEAIDAGSGKPLLVHCIASGRFESVRGHFAVDVSKLRDRLKAGESLSIWEKIAVGEHPARDHEWKSPAIR
jgi:DNA polymerase III alpha subunit